MKPENHLLLNLAAGALLLYLLGDFGLINLAMILIGGVIFDIDHLLYHAISKRNLSIKNFIAVHSKMFRSMTPGFYVFHTFEFIFLFTAAVFLFFPWLDFLAAGFLLHMASDIGKYFMHYRTDFSWVKHWSLFWNISGLASGGRSKKVF
jgi:hypothetical protein